MLMLTGQKDEKGREIGLVTGKALAEPKVKQLKGKKSGKPFEITSLFCKCDGDSQQDRTITIEGWGDAGRDLSRFHKGDGVMCFGAIYMDEWGGKAEMRCSLGIGKTNFEPVVRIPRGGISNDAPVIDNKSDIFVEITDQGQLPF